MTTQADSLESAQKMDYYEMEAILKVLPEPASATYLMQGSFDYEPLLDQVAREFKIDAEISGNVSIEVHEPSKEQICELYSLETRMAVEFMQHRFSRLALKEAIWSGVAPGRFSGDVDVDKYGVKVTPYGVNVTYFGKEPLFVQPLKDAMTGGYTTLTIVQKGKTDISKDIDFDDGT